MRSTPLTAQPRWVTRHRIPGRPTGFSKSTQSSKSIHPTSHALLPGQPPAQPCHGPPLRGLDLTSPCSKSSQSSKSPPERPRLSSDSESWLCLLTNEASDCYREGISGSPENPTFPDDASREPKTARRDTWVLGFNHRSADRAGHVAPSPTKAERRPEAFAWRWRRDHFHPDLHCAVLRAAWPRAANRGAHRTAFLFCGIREAE